MNLRFAIKLYTILAFAFLIENSVRAGQFDKFFDSFREGSGSTNLHLSFNSEQNRFVLSKEFLSLDQQQRVPISQGETLIEEAFLNLEEFQKFPFKLARNFHWLGEFLREHPLFFCRILKIEPSREYLVTLAHITTDGLKWESKPHSEVEESLQEVLALARTGSPMSELSLDILNQIFSHPSLSFSQRMNLRKVCKKWRNTIGFPLLRFSDRSTLIRKLRASAVSAQFDRLAVFLQPEVIEVWTLTQPRKLISRIPVDNEGSLDFLAFSQDGKFLVSHFRNSKKIRIWDIEQSKLHIDLSHVFHLEQLALSTQANILAGVDSQQNLIFWNLDTTEKIRETPMKVPRLFIGRTRAYHLQFSPDGKRIAATFPHLIQIWDTEPGNKPIFILTGDHNRNIAFSPDGDQIAASYFKEGYHIGIWELNTGKWTSGFRIPEYSESISYSKDGIFLANATASIVSVFNLKNKTLVHSKKLPNLTHSISEIRFSPSGCLLSAKSDNQALIISLKNGEIKGAFQFEDHFGNTGFSPDEKFYLVPWSRSPAHFLFNLPTP